MVVIVIRTNPPCGNEPIVVLITFRVALQPSPDNTAHRVSLQPRKANLFTQGNEANPALSIAVFNMLLLLLEPFTLHIILYARQQRKSRRALSTGSLKTWLRQ